MELYISKLRIDVNILKDSLWQLFEPIHSAAILQEIIAI